MAFPAVSAERSIGTARLSFREARGRSRLERLYQAGSAKAFVHASDAGPEVVFLNTSGGMTGGDQLSYSITLGEGCRITATTQTAERAYHSAGGSAEARVSFDVAEGAHLDWLPQETIFFDKSALHRRTEVSLAKTASCLLVETIVLGRSAMGETVHALNLNDHRKVTRCGVPVFFEPLVIGDAALSAGLGVLQGAKGFASIAGIAAGIEAGLPAVRAVLDEPGVQSGASGFDGKLTIRLLAVDSWPLRRQVLRLLEVLRSRPLPRVWQM